MLLYVQQYYKFENKIFNIQEFAPIPEHGPAGHKRFYEKRTS